MDSSVEKDAQAAEKYYKESKVIILLLLAVPLAFLLVFGTAFLAELFLAARQTRPHIVEAAANATIAIKNIKETSDILKATALSVKEIADQQKKELLRPEVIRSQELALQSGDNIARLVIKANNILENIQATTVPTLNKNLTDLDNSVNNLSLAVTHIDNAGQGALLDTGKTMRDIDEIILATDVRRLLKGLADTSERSATVATQLGISVTELVQVEKDLDTDLQDVDKGVKSFDQILGNIAKPETRKQRLLRYLVTVATIGAGVAAHH